MVEEVVPLLAGYQVEIEDVLVRVDLSAESTNAATINWVQQQIGFLCIGMPGDGYCLFSLIHLIFLCREIQDPEQFLASRLGF